MKSNVTAALMVTIAAGLLNRDVHTQNVPVEQVPARVRQAVAPTGTTGIDIIARPDGLYTGYVARLQFEAERPGYKACADHYPAFFVPAAQACPSLVGGDAPAAGWVACHGEFYAPAQAGCPPVPPTPTAPLTTPRPKCEWGPQLCAEQAPGGPVLIRTLRLQIAIAAAAADLSVAAPAATEPAPAGADRRSRAEARRRAEATAAQPGLADRATAAASETTTGIARGAATPVQPARPMQPARAAVAAGASPPRATVLGSEAFTTALRGSVKTRQWLAVKPTLHCTGQDCEWGDKDTPITLPAPRVAPAGHVPCEYEHVSFFVPENQFCPDPARHRPPPGVATYVAWSDDGQKPPEFYFHRLDYNGRDQVQMMLFGDTDDRFLVTEATAGEQAAADSTVVLVKRERVTQVDAQTARLQHESSWQPLCSDERFAALPRPGRCSGVKIGPRLVATSAHCVRNARQCADTSVVIGFPGRNGSVGSVDVPSRRVYQCESIVASRQPATIGERGADWTIFQVDRDMEGPDAALADSADVQPSVVTTVIGHPLGLPSIVTRLGVVQVKASSYFIANSDTFVGNSGSAVFSAQSVEDGAPRVLGLLTGGQYDFVDSSENGQSCLKAKWCKGGPECLGDDVIYANDLKNALERLGAGPAR